MTKENLLDIAELLLSKLKKNLQKKDIEFIITLPLKEKITDWVITRFLAPEK